jgi:GNAT superfamily N-acetyltransferase
MVVDGAPRVRDYTAADATKVLELITTILGEHGFSPDKGGLLDDLAASGERYGAPRGGFWVADLDGDVLGTVAIRPKEGDTCELKRLYVRADARRIGLGQLLYAHAEAFARGAGYQAIWLDSSRRFEKARRLYERNGFVLTAELDNDWEDNVYEKRLSARTEPCTGSR